MELHVSTPIPEWDGMVLPVRIEENARLTDSGVKYFVPRQTELLVIGGGAVGNAICTGSDSRFAPLRGAVPTGGRGLACGTLNRERRYRFRPAARRSEDRRSLPFPPCQYPLARPRRRGSVTPWSLPVSGSRQTICMEPVCQL